MHNFKIQIDPIEPDETKYFFTSIINMIEKLIMHIEQTILKGNSLYIIKKKIIYYFDSL